MDRFTRASVPGEVRLEFRRRIQGSLALATVLAVSLLSSSALAAGGGAGAGLPWESTFDTVLRSFEGIAQVLLVIAIMAMFAALMFGEAAGLSRKALFMIIGGAGIVAAPGVVSTLFTGATGALF